MQTHHRASPKPDRSKSIRQARLKFRLQRRGTHGGNPWLNVLGVSVGVLLALVVSSVITAFLAAPAAVVAASNYLELPDPDQLSQRDTALSTRILDRHGELLYELFDPKAGRRTHVALSDLPQSLIQATIATEDANFYDNPGIDYRGLVRAGYQNLSGTGGSGGSTITMQLIRNVFIPPEERTQRSLERKLKEALLAIQVSQQYSKDQILEMYLNEIYYGNLSNGIEAAAESYFGKNAKDLTLAESALLAGLPQAPSLYEPTTNPQAAKARQEEVLDLMTKQGYITQAEADAAKAVQLEYRAARYDIKAPHFVFYVRDWLEQQYGNEKITRGGLTVTTSLDLSLQQEAERIVKNQIDRVSRFNAHNAALVSIDPKTGEIIAMVGSVDYFNKDIDGQVNVATSLRQPGSSIKPVTYVTAFKKGYSPGTVINDEPLTIPDVNGKAFAPKNNDGTFRGPVSLRQALAMSLNIPAIKVLQFAGINDMIAMARDMGITTFTDPSRYGLSLTLGGGEVKLVDLTSAYTVFAADGIRHPATAVLKVQDSEGKVLYEHKVDDSKRVLSPELTYLITNILSDNAARAPEFGVDNPLRLASRPAAAKTGTTDDSRDAWTIGYTPDLVTGVWVGNSDNAPMVGILGSRAAGPIWNEFMEVAHQGLPVHDFQRPSDIVTVNLCAELNTNGSCAKTNSDLYIKGAKTATPIDLYARRQLVCKLDGKLADKGCNPEEVEDRSFLVVNGPDVPEAILKLGLPPMPTEYCSCYSGPRTIISGTNTISGTTGISGTVGITSTVGITHTNTITASNGITTPNTGPAPKATPAPAPTPTPASAPAGPAQGVAFVSPASNSTVKGTVQIVGTANIQDFAAYKLEFASTDAPWQRHTIAESTKPVTNGVLASWNTAGSPNSTYSVFLIVYDKLGRSQDVTLVLNVHN